MASVEIKQIWVINVQIEGKEVQWEPTVKEFDGIMFFLASKSNRPFVKACNLGKCLRLGSDDSKKVDANVKFLDTMARARHTACDAALQDALANPVDDQHGNGRNKKRRVKIIKATRKSSHLLPEIVTAEFDGFRDAGGDMAPTNMRVLTDKFWTKDIWVEMTKDNVMFIMRAARDDILNGRRGSMKGNKNQDAEEQGHDAGNDAGDAGDAGDADDASDEQGDDIHDDDNDDVVDAESPSLQAPAEGARGSELQRLSS